MQFKMESISLSGNQLQRSFTELRLFNARKKFKAVIKLVLAKARFEKRLRMTRQCLVSPGSGSLPVPEHEIPKVAASPGSVRWNSDGILGGVVDTVSSSVSDKYVVNEFIVSGKFGKIHKGQMVSSIDEVSITICDKLVLPVTALEAIKTEYMITACLPVHPHILRCYDFYEDDVSFFIVNEVICVEDVTHRLAKRSRYSELQARQIILCLLAAVLHCHDHNITHRNLCVENIKFTSRVDDNTLKLVDFSEAYYVTEDSGASGYCGSPGFVAPECLRLEKHGFAVDLWAVGILTVFLLTGSPPFGVSLGAYKKAVLVDGASAFRTRMDSAGVTAESKDFVSQLLVLRPTERMTAKNAGSHPWVSNFRNFISCLIYVLADAVETASQRTQRSKLIFRISAYAYV
jgi:serine/threonine protein kinase